MELLKVSHLWKSFAGINAVKDVSFELRPGEIFGMLGPNGAGKTTTIRMIMDIIAPDRGEVNVLGGAAREAKHRVGYLPEERGLYRNLKVLEVLVYLAELKGWNRNDARKRALDLLERVGLADRVQSKVRELSRGMQQKLQILAALINDPDLIILDEPFQGLDPVNLEVIKELLLEYRDAGKGIMLSSHQMNLVEVLCDRILLINKGEAVLYGNLSDIKQRYAGKSLRLRCNNTLPEKLPWVVGRELIDGEWRLKLDDDVTVRQALTGLLGAGVTPTFLEVESKPLAEIFIGVVGGGRRA